MDPYQQILHDVANAPNKETLAGIYTYVAGAYAAVPQFVQDVAAACQARDAQLTADKPFAPHELGQPMVQQLQPPVMGAPPPAPAPAAIVVHPVNGTPPGWMRNAAEIGIATRGSIGMGGLPALDVLRVALVDVACASYDCGCDLSMVDGLKEVSAATPAKCYEIAELMLMRIRAHMAELKKQNR